MNGRSLFFSWQKEGAKHANEEGFFTFESLSSQNLESIGQRGL